MNDNLSYCNHLFDNTTDGYLQIKQFSDKDTKITVETTKNNSLRNVILEKKDEKDVFITVNTHFIPSSTVNTIRQFRALYVDIDSTKYFKTELVYMVYDLVNSEVIPKPSMIVDSGRGIHLYWRIKNAPFGALYTWQQIEDYLYFNLKHLGADQKATDAARILRIPTTVNSKNNSNCKIIEMDDSIEYSMYDLREKYLGIKKKDRVYQLQFEQTKPLSVTPKRNKNLANNVVNYFNSYTLHIARAEDIKTLARLRNYNLNGYRNMAIHCYAYWMGLILRDTDELTKEVIDFNNSLTDPLEIAHIRAILRCVPKAIDKFLEYEVGIKNGLIPKPIKGDRNKKGYWYRNSTLIRRLDITPDEEKHMKTIIGKEEKYRRRREADRAYSKAKRRNEDGITYKQAELNQLAEEVVKLRESGLSIRKIATELGKSKGTIENILKKIKNK